MSFDSILGHERPIDRLKAAIRSGRLSHAYLFVGPEGVGKALVAQELAKAVLCLAEEDDRPCDECRACRKVSHGNHPDVRVFAPADGSRFIKIETIRELQREISLKPMEGRYRAFVLDDCHSMTPESSNCLLKTLEEPPDASLLMLVTAKPEALLDTIISRCQPIRFSPLPLPEFEGFLAERQGIQGPQAKFLARYAHGSPGRAARLLSEGVLDRRQWAIENLSAVSAADNFRIAAEILAYTRKGSGSQEERRAKARELFGYGLLLYRDLLLLKHGASPDLLLNVDYDGLVQERAGDLGVRQVEQLVQVVLDTQEQLDRNANIDLAVENGITKLAVTMESRAQ